MATTDLPGAMYLDPSGQVQQFDASVPYNNNIGSGPVPGNWTPYQPTGNDTYSQPSSGASAPAPNLNQSYIDVINGALGRLPGQLQTAQSNIQDQYNTQNNSLDSGKAQAQNSYNTGTTQNQQSFVNNKNQINDQASTGLRSLLRVLGQRGAGGSSAALYAAPNAVGQVAQTQRAGAGQNFGQNQTNLDTTLGNYNIGFNNEKQKLSDWLTQQNNQAQQTSEGAKQGLLQQLIGLQPSVAAAQPFVDQINSSANAVDALGRFSPTYTGNTPTYTPPALSSYTAKQTGAPTLGGATSNTSAGNPTLAYLLGLGKDKNPQNSALQPTF